jgi:hypothetical protein
MGWDEFDYDILSEYIPDGDKRYFICWDQARLITQTNSVVATYRAPGWVDIVIGFDEYQMRVKEKARLSKINEIVQ